jgi:hypothetical protein
MGVRNQLVCALLVLGFSGCTDVTTTHRSARTIRIEGNQRLTFEHDAVRTGDTIVCVLDGATVGGAVVPPPGQFVAGIGEPADPDGNAVTVNVSNQGGTVTAQCSLG